MTFFFLNQIWIIEVSDLLNNFNVKQMKILMDINLENSFFEDKTNKFLRRTNENP